MALVIRESPPCAGARRQRHRIAAFPFALMLDGNSLQGGFGPALQLVTLPNGRIVAGP